MIYYNFGVARRFFGQGDENSVLWCDMSKKTLYFDGYCGYYVSAILEDGKLSEFSFEKISGSDITGNVYKGKVESVLPGMRAAFVNCGLDKNCYLSTEGVIPEGVRCTGEGDSVASVPELKEGDEILVQVVKPPVGTKGAKVVMHPSFVGKCLIYMPETPFIGVSGKISDAELRRNLAYSAKRLVGENEGIVLRSAAPYVNRGQLERECAYLKNLYREIKKAFVTAKTGELLYTDFALPIRVLRDILSKDINGVVVGSSRLKEQIEDMIKKLYPPQSRRAVALYDKGGDMFKELGISAQIADLASPRVMLDNGAEIVIEKTEAMTVVDVNTGKFTGDDSLEQTVYYTNILAAREIARQVRLRNIGGLVVVDFIDMKNAAHRTALEEELKRALADDKAKCAVSGISRFGLIEFTRKRSGTDPLAKLVKPCRHCGGKGRAFTREYLLFGFRARILAALLDGIRTVRADINSGVLEKLSGWREFCEDLKARAYGAEIFFVPHKAYREEQFSVSGDCSRLPENAVNLNSI